MPDPSRSGRDEPEPEQRDGIVARQLVYQPLLEMSELCGRDVT
jgi:hypothetical protein